MPLSQSSHWRPFFFLDHGALCRLKLMSTQPLRGRGFGVVLCCDGSMDEVDNIPMLIRVKPGSTAQFVRVTMCINLIIHGNLTPPSPKPWLDNGP